MRFNSHEIADETERVLEAIKQPHQAADAKRMAPHPPAPSPRYEARGATKSLDFEGLAFRQNVVGCFANRHRRSSARTDVRRFEDFATLCSHTKRCLRQRPVVPNAISHVCPRCEAIRRFFSTESCDIKLDRNRPEGRETILRAAID